MRSLITVMLLLLTLSVAHCAGTETDNPFGESGSGTDMGVPDSPCEDPMLPGCLPGDAGVDAGAEEDAGVEAP